MRSYDLPGETADLAPEQARQALNKMNADRLADQEHPFGNGSHPQHADFTAYSTKLYAVIATAEAEEKDAAQAQALEDARAETGDLTPAECLIRGRELLKTPGYLAGTMPPKERDQLKKQIDAMYLVGCQQDPSTPEETEIDDDA